MAEYREELLRDLREGDETHRLEAVQALAYIQESSYRIVQALERVAASDASQQVQKAALAALAMPVHHQIRCWVINTNREREAQEVLSHLDEWEADGLLTPQLAALLKGRYTLVPETPNPVAPQEAETALPAQDDALLWPEEVEEVIHQELPAPTLPETPAFVIPSQPTPPVLPKTAEQAFNEVFERDVEQLISKPSGQEPVRPPKSASPVPPHTTQTTPDELFDRWITAVDKIASKPSIKQPEKAHKPTLPAPPKKREAVKPPQVSARTQVAKKTARFYDGEIAVVEEEPQIEEPHALEKQKFSLVGTLTSEVTIRIVLYLGAFLIIAAAVVFAGLYPPARFPMLTFTLLGFLTGARFTVERIPLGSFVLFVIGTLLIPIDAVIGFDLYKIEDSPLAWSVVIAGMSAVWGGGTYYYRSRFFSLMVFATFSISIYLIAYNFIPINSVGFLLVVGLVALAGLGEAVFLRRWQGDDFFEPIFIVAQLQAAGVFLIAALELFPRAMDRLLRVFEDYSNSGFDSDSKGATWFGIWLTLGAFYFASDYLTWHTKKWNLPIFRVLVTACLLTPPIFILETMSPTPTQIAAVLWGWGALAVVASEALYRVPVRWIQSYSSLFMMISIGLLIVAPLLAYAASLDRSQLDTAKLTYAALLFMATGIVYFVVTYRRKNPIVWVVALLTSYLAYLVGIQALNAGAAQIFWGFALVIPALVFLSGELAGRRYFQANSLWIQPPLWFGLFNLALDVLLLLGWYDDHPGRAAIGFFIYGLFGIGYAVLDNERERGSAFYAWVAGLMALYIAYVNILPNITQIGFGGYALLVPALVFLTAEMIAKRYFHLSQFWTKPLLIFGLINLAVDVYLTFATGLQEYPDKAAIIFLIYGLFGIFYTRQVMLADRSTAVAAWTAGMISLYIAYMFVYRMVAEEQAIFAGFTLLIPAIVFLSAEMFGKLYLRVSKDWTLPLFGLGLLNAVLVVPVALSGGLGDYPGNAVISFLIYGLFGILYTRLTVQHERNYAIIAWTVSMIALYTAYVFCYRLPGIDLDIFSGYFLLLPALIFLSGELLAKLYYRVSDDWTLPLLGLGLLNAILVIPVTFGGGLSDHPGDAALIFLIYGLFAIFYTRLKVQVQRSDAIIAWTVSMLALYAAYGFACLLPAVGDLDIFGGFLLLLPALVFLSGELLAKLYYRVSQTWSLPLLLLGLFNANLVVPLTLAGGADTYAGSAALIFLIYGLFGVVYARLDVQERHYAVTAWSVGLIALYAAYGFTYRLLTLEGYLDLFLGFALLIPAAVFLAGELAGKVYFRAGESWTRPLLGLGVLNAVLVIPVALAGGLNEYPGSAALIFLLYGVLGVFYTRLGVRAERQSAVVAWTAALLALYAAYGFTYRVLVLDGLDIFPGYAILMPTIIFLSGELLGKLYYRVHQAWTLPLLALGLFNAVLFVPLTFKNGMSDYPGSAALAFLIYGLFGILYARLVIQKERDHAIVAWNVGLIALYLAYWFVYFLLWLEGQNFFVGFALLMPTLVFLSAELLGKLYFRVSQVWTLSLFALGVFNMVLFVPFILYGGLRDHPGAAAIAFLIYGLFAVIYARLIVQTERDYSIVAWIMGLVTLYLAYFFGYRLLWLDDRDIFLGLTLLVAVIVFLSGELLGKRYFRVSEVWTLPLFGLGLFNLALLAPITLDGGLGSYPGSAAIIFLIFGLFSSIYAALDMRSEGGYLMTAWVVVGAVLVSFGLAGMLPELDSLDDSLAYAILMMALVGLYTVQEVRSELGYVATVSITLALASALRYYDQEQWVVPFTLLAVVYYVAGFAVHAYFDRSDWSRVLYWSGLILGTGIALAAPLRGGGDAVAGMAITATLYGAEGFRQRNVWFGIPANLLFLGAYLIALLELKVVEPQFYSVGTGLLAIITHYLLTRRSEQQAAFVIGFGTGVTAQVILLGTGFIQMGNDWQFFFVLFFESIILLGYGLVTRSLSFTVIPIVFLVAGVLRVVFTLAESYMTVFTLGCTGFGLVSLGIAALFLRERLLKAYEELQHIEAQSGHSFSI